MPPEEHALAAGWLSALNKPPVRAGLEAVYTAAAERIAARGPACWASGRCCNFDRARHQLWVTGLEAAYTIAGLQRVGPPTVETIDAAVAEGGCPFQACNLCGVHPVRPLACRLYFCDASAQSWQQEALEELIADVRLLHDRFGLTYRYGEWRAMLRRFAHLSPPHLPPGCNPSRPAAPMNNHP
jgi:Fe-S-cluster containining protein